MAIKPKEKDELQRSIEMQFTYQSAHATLAPQHGEVPGVRLIAISEPGGKTHQWRLRVVPQRNTFNDVDLGEMDSALLPAVQDPSSPERSQIMRNGEGFAKVCRALVSIGGRPSDYGFTRAELRTIDPAELLVRLPKYEPIGKAKTELTDEDINEVSRALGIGKSYNRLADQLLRALAGRPNPRRSVAVWVSAKGYEQMLKDAIASDSNVAALVLSFLPAEYR